MGWESKRASEDSPTLKKVRQLEELADKLGIIIEGPGALRITDSEFDLVYEYQSEEGEELQEFPYYFDGTKLVREVYEQE